MATALASDPLEAAELAGLRYTSDDRPGIRRKRQGRHFTFVDRDGRAIRDRAERRRIERLAIPPAWTDVWISPDPLGHLQATGRDARGRKQYRYHERWRAVRDETKYGRLVPLAKLLTRIRGRVQRDLARQGVPREKVLAAVVRLLEETAIRVGNEEYARANRSFGLTTLRNRHVDVSGTKIVFRFRGKSGKEHEVRLRDRRLARIVAKLEEPPHLGRHRSRGAGPRVATGTQERAARAARASRGDRRGGGAPREHSRDLPPLLRTSGGR